MLCEQDARCRVSDRRLGVRPVSASAAEGDKEQLAVVPRQATFARSESSLADAITRRSVNSTGAYRRVVRSLEREGEGMCRQISHRPVSLPDPVHRRG